MAHFNILDLEHFATASHRCIGVVNKTRRRSVCGLHPTMVERVVAKCTSLLYVGRLNSTPLLRVVLDYRIYKLFPYTAMQQFARF